MEQRCLFIVAKFVVKVIDVALFQWSHKSSWVWDLWCSML